MSNRKKSEMRVFPFYRTFPWRKGAKSGARLKRAVRLGKGRGEGERESGRGEGKGGRGRRGVGGQRGETPDSF